MRIYIKNSLIAVGGILIAVIAPAALLSFDASSEATEPLAEPGRMHYAGVIWANVDELLPGDTLGRDLYVPVIAIEGEIVFPVRHDQ